MMPRVVSVVDRFKILARDNFRCVYCGAGPQQAQLQIDHVLPRSRGGADHFDNYATACFFCNIGKSDVILEEILGRTEYSNAQWRCNPDGIECLTHGYFIEGERINEIATYIGPWCSEWPLHIAHKKFNLELFIDAFYQAFVISGTPMRFDWQRSIKEAREYKKYSDAWSKEYQIRLAEKYNGKVPFSFSLDDMELMSDFIFP